MKKNNVANANANANWFAKTDKFLSSTTMGPVASTR
jgi:hypothetical protein